MVGMVGKPPKGSFVLDEITWIPALEGSPYSVKKNAPVVPFGAVTLESYLCLIAPSPFPSLLLPVYAYQCVRSPVAKFILTGQVCIWDDDRNQINRNKTL